MDLVLGLRDGVPARDQGFVQGTIKLLVETPVVEVRLVWRGVAHVLRVQ